MNTNIKQISKNPTAYHNYNIEEKIRSGNRFNTEQK